MISYFKRYTKNFDFPLFITYLFLCLFGLVMIYSASMEWAVKVYDYEPDHFYQRQLINLLVAVPVFLIAAFIPYKHYRRKPIASVFANKKTNKNLDSINESIAPPVTILVFAFFSVLFEVDMGTAGIILFVSVSVLAASGIRFKTFAKLFSIIFGLILIISPILYLLRDKLITPKILGFKL
jgi:cell division protein FtsW